MIHFQRAICFLSSWLLADFGVRKANPVPEAAAPSARPMELIFPIFKPNKTDQPIPNFQNQTRICSQISENFTKQIWFSKIWVFGSRSFGSFNYLPFSGIDLDDFFKRNFFLDLENLRI